MTAPPLMRLWTCQGWHGVALVDEVHRIPGWTVFPTFSPCSSIISGLRGTGQALRGPTNAFRFAVGSRWNTFGVGFDCLLNSAIGTDERLMYIKLLDGILDVRRSSTGKLYVRNDAASGTPSWTTTRTFPSSVVKKVELLCYPNGTRGYMQLYVEGQLWLDERDIILAQNASTHAGTDYFQPDNVNMDFGEFFLYVGDGGFSEGDVRSDTVGNPRVIGVSVADLVGSYNDATPSVGFGTHASLVDEVPNNKTDYNSIASTSPTFRDSYFLDSFPAGMTKILGILGMFYTRNTSGGQQPPPVFLRVNPAVDEYAEAYYHEPSISSWAATTSFDQYWSGLWRKSPATGAAFVPGEVDDKLELGWGPQGSGTTEMSAVYAEVLCYLNPPAAAVVGSAPRSLLKHKTHYLAKLWKVQPRWGPPLYFTNHSNAIEFKGSTYLPAGGFSATSTSKSLGLEESDADFAGVISSAAITIGDFLSGKLIGAKIYEMTVDWRHPWAGAVLKKLWTVEDYDGDGERFVVTVSGPQSKLYNLVGDVYTPRCRANLFDKDYPDTQPDVEKVCKLDAMYYSLVGDVGTVTNRSSFNITGAAAGASAGWFDDGRILFLTGNNMHVAAEVKTHTAGHVQLFLEMPFDVTALDVVRLWPGCDKLIGTVNPGDCEDKYDNVINFGGEDDIPGTRKTLRGYD